MKEKRKADALTEEVREAGQDAVAKRLKQEERDPLLTEKIIATRGQALRLWIKQMENGTDTVYQDLYGIHWEEGKKYEAEILTTKQAEAREEQRRMEDVRLRKEEARRFSLVPATVFKDDLDPMY